MEQLECITQGEQALVLIHPLRQSVLKLAQQPASATEMARTLNLPRQKVNYHVRELARAGLLRPAGRHRKRNMIEQRYQATARAYVLSPEILGPLAADRRQIEDHLSAAHLLAVTSQAQTDLSRAMGQAAEQKKHLSTMSLSTEIRFETPEQRAAFAEALSQALVDVILRHSSPYTLKTGDDTGEPGPGRPYRLVLGCYPIPPEPKEP